MNRNDILTQIKQLSHCDLLVIGAGATGCGIAFDAASRGLSVVLVEQNDFAEGTSSRSSKLVHGGVRYLEMAVKHLDRAQYDLVKEGLHERYYFLRNAPHLSQPLPLISPIYRWSQLPYVWIGLKLYDFLAGQQGLGPSGYASCERTIEEFPFIQKKGLKGGVRYFDGLFNDSRMAISLALSAIDCGALAANHLQVEALDKTRGKITGAVLQDRLSGERFAISATTVVNATGPFGDQVRQLDDPQVQPLLMVSSGVHLVLDDSYPPPKAGLLISETEDQRVLFVLPWQGRCLVGTTDQPTELREHPHVVDEDVDYLLRHLEEVLDPPPTRENITAAWAGLRPLVHDPKAHDSSRVLRDFIIEESASGLFTIVGGKWTSYRRMAEKLVDRVVEKNARKAKVCRTRELPVHGAQNWQPSGWQQLVKQFSMPEATARYLHSNYGCYAPDVAQLAGQGYATPLADGVPCLEAEVIHACRSELAQRAIDVLARRLPLALLDTELSKQVSDRVLSLMSVEMNWDLQRCTEERDLLEKRLTEGL
jgi:glycerol-3-phosphate dehydrogenase